MGCCLSATNNSSRKIPDEGSHQFNVRSLVPEPELRDHVGKIHDRRRAQPSQSAIMVVEEESVKEVLSETPIWRPPQEEHKVLLEKKSNTTQLPRSNLLHAELAESKEVVSEISQVSDTCGISESFSLSTTTTTTTVTEVREEDEATSRRKREGGSRASRLNLNGSHSQQAKTRRKRPHSADDLASRRERRRPEFPSEKRSARGGRAAETRTMQRTLGPTSAGARRDTGGVASRRSRSPATRTVGGANQVGMRRSPSKTTGRACGRSMQQGEDEEGGTGSTTEVQNDGVLQGGNESLENPLVSLECFIFL